MPNMDGILLGPGPLAIAVTKPYSSSYLWKNGEYCTQNGKIYKFISTDLEETGETWTPAHWAETKLTDEIIGLGQRIDSLDPESGVGLFTDIAFEINSNQWTEDTTNGVWNYNYSNSLIKATSGIAVYYDNSYISALSGHISVTKNTGYVTFTTNGQPQNRLTGTLRIVDSVSGVLPVSSGGTGAVTSKGARTNLNVSIKPICVSFGTVSSLPQTLTDINNPLYADINTNMIPSKWVFGNPAACPNGLKCTTAAGAVTISLPDANSTFSGETTVYLELVDPQTSADSGTGTNDQQYTGDFVQIGAQSLTTTQKAQARTNIGAANAEDVSTLSEHFVIDTTEAEVGKFGTKTIYRKIFTGTSSSTPGENILIASGISEIVRAGGYITTASGAKILVPYTWGASADGVRFLSRNGNLEFQTSGSGLSSVGYKVWVEYTKS